MLSIRYFLFYQMGMHRLMPILQEWLTRNVEEPKVLSLHYLLPNYVRNVINALLHVILIFLEFLSKFFRISAIPSKPPALLCVLRRPISMCSMNYRGAMKMSKPTSQSKFG